ncbi:hypothetical protein HZA98_02350 [Candidatus Woesearchaeota archaeon]|nr:hypothetical protein [Candidatus Woesearchaeota archaeon]
MFSRQEISNGLHCAFTLVGEALVEKEYANRFAVIGDHARGTDCHGLYQGEDRVFHLHGSVEESDCHFLALYGFSRSGNIEDHVAHLALQERYGYRDGRFAPKTILGSGFTSAFGEGFHIEWQSHIGLPDIAALQEILERQIGADLASKVAMPRYDTSDPDFFNVNPFFL